MFAVIKKLKGMLVKEYSPVSVRILQTAFLEPAAASGNPFIVS